MARGIGPAYLAVPSALLKHGGVVLLRQREGELNLDNRGFVLPYLRPWMFPGEEGRKRLREAFIEEKVNHFRRSRRLAEDPLYRGADAGGRLTTEADVRADAEAAFPTYLERLTQFDADEAAREAERAPF